MRPAGFLQKLGPIFGLLTMTLVGCGQEGGYPMPTTSAPASAPARALASGNFVVDNSESMRIKQPAADAPAEKQATAGRKIIYNAHVDLVTEDLNTFEAGLNKLIAAQKAYVADSDRSGSAGSSRHGSWKVRVPVDAYDVFVKGAVALGELVSVKADSQDVSEEFFDLEAHQKAKEVEEARLLKHLTETTGKLEEILAVERELSRVRSEIERMQGRLRALSNLTTLATVTVTANEIKGYVPPQAPTLATKVGRTFSDSLQALRDFGEGLLLLIVGLAPWLPIIALGFWFIFMAYRRIIRPAA